MSKKTIKAKYIDSRYFEYFRAALSAALKDPVRPVKAADVCRDVGISRPETLMRHYQHVSKKLHRETVAKIPALRGG